MGWGMIKKGFPIAKAEIILRKYIWWRYQERIKTSRYRNDKIASSLLKREIHLILKLHRHRPHSNKSPPLDGGEETGVWEGLQMATCVAVFIF